MDKWGEILLADADVLIDYVKGGISILSLAAENIGAVYVLRQVLDTVDMLSARDCRRHRIQVIQADTDSLIEAGTRNPALSLSRTGFAALLAETEVGPA